MLLVAVKRLCLLKMIGGFSMMTFFLGHILCSSFVPRRVTSIVDEVSVHLVRPSTGHHAHVLAKLDRVPVELVRIGNNPKDFNKLIRGSG